MGSKKHKKESKKKKHRSRSRSPLDGEERERKRHKKHKDRKKDRSPDVEEVPLDSHLPQPPVAPEAHSRSASKERDRRIRGERKHDREKEEKERAHEPSPEAAGGGGQDSLSIEETNRLRAKLGLKPLELEEKPAEDGKLKDDLGEFYHKPAANISEIKKSEKIRQKLEERREKRKLEQKLKTKTLGEESEEDDDPMAWVQRSRQIEQQKQEAAKRAAMLDEMDEVFGVSALVEEERAQDLPQYSAHSLRGLRVAHDIDALGDERETILTLADKPVLAEDAEDVLVNVNIVDDERYKKNISERKKARAGYQAYDEAAELAAARGAARPVLPQYDDERGPAGFRIGHAPRPAHTAHTAHTALAERAMTVDKRLESLQLPQLKLASDYMDEHEIQAKFKKPKKKGKMRKKPKHEPIDVDEYDPASAPLDTDDTEVPPEGAEPRARPVQDDEETEPDVELQAALARARRLALDTAHAHAHAHAHADTHAHAVLPKVEEILESVKKEEPEAEEETSSGMVLDATAEFCRTLGDIPTYGLAGNRDHHAEIIDFEREDTETEAEAEAEGGAWSRVDVDSELPADLVHESAAGLGAEPRLGAGVAGALQLALSKGYLERAGAGPAPRSQHLHLLAARHYSIEDKTHAGEDDKYGRRERGGGHSGPLVEFREKSSFRPDVKLEYVDDEGRPLCPKEAFRYLSHKFHGKGPGKNKQEKRIKKAVQEGLMKKMSSTDTPLNTLQMLQDKQRETRSPYVLLSGAKRGGDN